MAAREVLLLGNPLLYETSAEVGQEELREVSEVVSDLHDTMMDFRRRYGAGRAIAAPQIGVMKRIIYMHVDDSSRIFINPEMKFVGMEKMEIWDDCMCFPDLLVKVRRHKSCLIRFLNEEWEEEEALFEDDLSELLQHEYDHLDGILAVSRAIDGRSFALRSQREFLGGY